MWLCPYIGGSFFLGVRIIRALSVGVYIIASESFSYLSTTESEQLIEALASMHGATHRGLRYPPHPWICSCSAAPSHRRNDYMAAICRSWANLAIVLESSARQEPSSEVSEGHGKFRHVIGKSHVSSFQHGQWKKYTKPSKTNEQAGIQGCK